MIKGKKKPSPKKRKTKLPKPEEQRTIAELTNVAYSLHSTFVNEKYSLAECIYVLETIKTAMTAKVLRDTVGSYYGLKQ